MFSRAQLLAEIKIHRCLSHRYIVGFESFFEDKANVYIMLELCASQVRARARARAHEAARAAAAKSRARVSTLARFSFPPTSARALARRA